MDAPYADFLFLLLIFAGVAGLAAFAKVVESVTAQGTPAVVTADAAARPAEATTASANDVPRPAEEPRA